WTIVPSPNAGPNASPLWDVDAISATDVWAVGYYCCTETALITLVEHWDGSQWSIVPSPNPAGHVNNYLFGVAAASANDIWAAGYTQCPTGCRWQTLIEHYSYGASGCPTLTPAPTRTPTATRVPATYTPTSTPTTTPCNPNFSDVTPTNLFYEY